MIPPGFPPGFPPGGTPVWSGAFTVLHWLYVCGILRPTQKSWTSTKSRFPGGENRPPGFSPGGKPGGKPGWKPWFSPGFSPCGDCSRVFPRVFPRSVKNPPGFHQGGNPVSPLVFPLVFPLWKAGGNKKGCQPENQGGAVRTQINANQSGLGLQNFPLPHSFLRLINSYKMTFDPKVFYAFYLTVRIF